MRPMLIPALITGGVSMLLATLANHSTAKAQDARNARKLAQARAQVQKARRGEAAAKQRVKKADAAARAAQVKAKTAQAKAAVVVDAAKPTTEIPAHVVRIDDAAKPVAPAASPKPTLPKSGVVLTIDPAGTHTPPARKPAAKPATVYPVARQLPAPLPAPERSPLQAATDLLKYVTPILRAGRGSQLGTKGAPNATVQRAQQDMRSIVADGIYGPATRARGKALLGVAFPARTP